jgi:hypothetical protein
VEVHGEADRDREGEGKVRVLKLERETLRELDAADLKQAQGAGPGPTKKCLTEHRCSRPTRCV